MALSDELKVTQIHKGSVTPKAIVPGPLGNNMIQLTFK